MTADDIDDHDDHTENSRHADPGEGGVGIDVDIEGADGPADGSDIGPRERLEREADRAISEFDEGLVDLLAWLLDTETRARIYVYLRQRPGATSEEVADGTGLYPSTVREALADLADEGTVTRRKREHDGAGNNPYEYTAIAPSDLVRNAAEQVQSELNEVFNMDGRFGGDGSGSSGSDPGPVTITVDEERTAADASDDGSGGSASGGSDDDSAGSDADDDPADSNAGGNDAA
jgi:predicted transcriptional regulator